MQVKAPLVMNLHAYPFFSRSLVSSVPMEKNGDEKKSGKRGPGVVWILLISVWIAFVYILWFMNLVRDFVPSQGGW